MARSVSVVRHPNETPSRSSSKKSTGSLWAEGRGGGGREREARIHHRYTSPVINSRPMPYPLWYPAQPCTYRYTFISLPPVPWIFALARTEIRARTKEGSLERMHELSPVKYCSGFLRVWQTYRGKRARTEIFYSTEISIDLSLLLLSANVSRTLVLLLKKIPFVSF